MNYKSFDDWYHDHEENRVRSDRIKTEFECSFADPFKKSDIIKKWLRIAWDMGYNASEQKNSGGQSERKEY